MSQSPHSHANADGEALFRYRKAWAAINTLLEKGSSLSGRERNRAFLNTGQARFADVSASIGLDQIDDSRGVAITDWDHDGKLDLWMTNRNGPWIRFMHNNSRTGNRFLALKLEGKTCNRDAIGARVELQIDGQRPLVKVLRAGEGFVAQSSKWLHFGLANCDRIQRMLIRWPGSKVEVVETGGLVLDRFYTLSQGSPTPMRWHPPSSQGRSLTHVACQAPVDESSNRRVVLAARIPLVDPSALDFQPGSPMLINLWASWCTPCRRELAQITARQQDLRAKGLRILAVSVDELGENGESGRNAATVLLKTLNFPFGNGFATHDDIANLELIATSAIDKHDRLPVPSSFLVDAKGRVAVIYKGLLEIDRLISDLKLIDAKDETLRDRAAHFPGRWFHAPPKANPAPIIKGLAASGNTSEAADYLAQWADSDVSESFYFLANVHRQQGHLLKAVGTYRKALEQGVDPVRVHLELGVVLSTLKKHSEAVPHLEIAVAADPGNLFTRRKLVVALAQSGNIVPALPHLLLLAKGDPNDAPTYLLLGDSHRLNGEPVLAEAAYVHALKLKPGWPPAGNQLAWMLATHPQDSVRNGERAVALAEAICKSSNYNNPALLDTLGAAYAELGRFDDALKTIRRAIALTGNSSPANLNDELQQRLSLYLNHKPYRQ